MGYEVFISFKRNALDGSGKTRDYEIASDLHKALKDAGVEAFMSEKDLFTYDFRRKIDDALDETKILVAVGTSRDNMESENVRYEWTSFHNDILSRIKPDAQIFSYIEGMNHNDLPRALRHYESLTTDEKTRLVEMIVKNLSKTALKLEPADETVPKIQVTPIPQAEMEPQTNSDLNSHMHIQVGDRIPFGQYPQGVNGEVQPLMWRVLAVKNGVALLITDKLIDCVRYNESYTYVTWETCTLRKWMNKDFIKKAFSYSQEVQIVTVTNHTTCGTKVENVTQDRIFALSMDEAMRYFRDDRDRMSVVTEYAKIRGVNILDDRLAKKYQKNGFLKNGETTGIWWLRSKSNITNLCANNIMGCAHFVYAHGNIEQTGTIGETITCNNVGVRPAFWLNLT